MMMKIISKQLIVLQLVPNELLNEVCENIFQRSHTQHFKSTFFCLPFNNNDIKENFRIFLNFTRFNEKRI